MKFSAARKRRDAASQYYDLSNKYYVLGAFGSLGSGCKANFII